MNVELIKQVISDHLPEDVIISDFNVKENAGKLMVEICWNLKDEKPGFSTEACRTISSEWKKSKHITPISDAINTPEFRKKLAAEVALYPVSKALEPIMFDGYGPFFNLDQSEQCVSMNIDNLMSWVDDNRRDGVIKTRAEIDALNAKSIRDAEDGYILNELRKALPFTPVIDIDTSSKPALDRVVATKGSDKYINSLIRAGINPERAREMAGNPANEPIMSGVNWPISETKTTIENPTGLVPNQPPGSIAFRRTEPDSYAVIDENGKLVERPRVAKKPTEVVDEYTNAVKSYAKRFHVLGKLPCFGDKGKHNMASVVAHELPLSNQDRKITDVEIMLLTNDNFILNPIVDGIETGLKKITAEFNKRFNAAKTEKQLADVRSDILGKHGSLTNILHLLGSAPSKYRVKLGDKINVVRASVDLAFNERLSEIRKDKPTPIIKCKQIFSHIKDIGKIIFK